LLQKFTQNNNKKVEKKQGAQGALETSIPGSSTPNSSMFPSTSFTPGTISSAIPNVYIFNSSNSGRQNHGSTAFPGLPVPPVSNDSYTLPRLPSVTRQSETPAIELPIRPSSAIDPSVLDERIWEAFKAFMYSAFDKQHHKDIGDAIESCIDHKYSLQLFKELTATDISGMLISTGTWRRMRGQITLFTRQFKGELTASRESTAASVLESFRNLPIPSVEGNRSSRELSSTVDIDNIRDEIRRVKQEMGNRDGSNNPSVSSPRPIDGGVISSDPSSSESDDSTEEDEEYPENGGTQRENDNGEDSEVEA